MRCVVAPLGPCFQPWHGVLRRPSLLLARAVAAECAEGDGVDAVVAGERGTAGAGGAGGQGGHGEQHTIGYYQYARRTRAARLTPLVVGAWQAEQLVRADEVLMEELQQSRRGHATALTRVMDDVAGLGRHADHQAQGRAGGPMARQA